MDNLLEKLDETVAYIQNKVEVKPQIGLILGTGLGNLANEIEADHVFPYTSLPHFLESTIMGHDGNLIFGHLGNKPVVAMQGRYHYYEGYSMQEVSFPVRVMCRMGIDKLIISNSSGGVNPDYNAGDLVLVRDHINFQPDNPLRGTNHDELGPRFPDLSNSYDQQMGDKALQIAHDENITCHEGVYVSVMGPSLETPAEYKMFNTIGGDVIGMSTVPEVLVARHQGVDVAVFSVVANLGYPPGKASPTSHEEVVEMANKVEPKLTKVVKRLIVDINEQ